MSVHETPHGWRIRWRQGDGNKSLSLKRSDGFTYEDAVALDNSKKRRKKYGGLDPQAGLRPFEGVVEEWWLAKHSELAGSTKDAIRSYVERFILTSFQGMRLCDIQPPEVEELKRYLESVDIGGPTIRKVLFTLSGIFDHAIRMGYRENNPVEKIRKPGAYRQRLIQPFPPERVEKLREYFLERDDIESATMVSVLAYSGCRPEEAFAGLTWGDVNGRSIIFRSAKTGRDRSTRLLLPLRADLENWKRASGRELGPVFGWSDSKFRNWRRRKFQKACDELGIPMSRPYDLRHAFATLLAGEGKNARYIGEQLGHNPSTGERWYTHLVSGDPQDAEESIREARRAA
jgi:integrase